MNNFIIKHFIKDYENVKDKKVRDSYGKCAGIVGILTNLILCGFKVLVGIFTASIAIIADGINNLADASSSIITLIGFKMAQRPEDEDHPFGHARIEYLTGLFISVIIIVVGVLLLKSSVIKIFDPEVLEFTTTSIVILVVAIMGKMWQASFYRTLGKRIDSVALLATATDSRNDVISTTVVLIGVIITKATGLCLDGYLGSLVALFIIYSGIELIKETSSPLLGEAPSDELVKDICEIVLAHEEVIGVHDLMVHNYGPGNIFASIHVEVDASIDIMVSHDLIDNIESEIAEKLRIEFVIHMDPVKVNDPILLEIATIVATCVNQIEGLRGFHDLRAVPGPSHTNVIFDIVMTSDCQMTENQIVKHIDTCVKEINPTFFVVINFDKAYTTLI